MSYLELRDLSVAFSGARAIRDISLSIGRGSRTGIVGESGSGKSMLAYSMMGMAPDAAQVTGSIRIDGQEMMGAGERAWQRRRGRSVAMIFQEPLSALNPLMKVGAIVAEPLQVHLGFSASRARARVLELFDEVGLPEPEARLKLHPHELSGGQRQRVLIALALASDPAVLIADEPTTALDAQVALRIIALLTDLSARRDMALVFISHDLAAIARASEELVVMYGGDIVERGATRDVLADPRHPYTKGLIGARPALDPDRPRRTRLPTIAGTVPPLAELAQGCRFAGRCPIEMAHCAEVRPALRPDDGGRLWACHHHQATAAAAPAGLSTVTA